MRGPVQISPVSEASPARFSPCREDLACQTYAKCLPLYTSLEMRALAGARQQLITVTDLSV